MNRVFLLFLLFLEFLVARGTRYDLPPGTKFNNIAGNLTEIAMANGRGRYRLLNNGTADLLSDNRTFALAFFDPNSTGDFFLALMLQAQISNRAAAAVPVWIANKNNASSDGTTLMLTQTHRKFILQNGGGTVLWNSNDVTNIAGIELQESGNMVFYDNGSNSLWQSFDNPGDTIVQKQVLRTGGSALTSSSKTGGFSAGDFSARVSASGFILSTKDQQPYGSWSLQSGGAADVGSASIVCDRSAVLGYAGDGIGLWYESNSSSSQLTACASKSPVQILKNSMGQQIVLPFLRLNPDGDLVSYRFDAAAGDWRPDSAFSEGDPCRLPFACGPYGICERGSGKCRCLQIPSRGNESYGYGGVSSKNSKNSSSDGTMPCAMPTLGIPHPDECENEIYNHHFLNLTATSYFSIDSSQPSRRRSSLQQCSMDCLANCSCAALFFRGDSSGGGAAAATGDCFFVEQALIGSMRMDGNTSAHIKFQNKDLLYGPIPITEEDSKGRNLVQIVAGVSAGVALLLLVALAIVIVKNRRRMKKKLLGHSEIDAVLSSVRGLPQRFSYAALDAATKNFSIKLGSGGFGSVYEGFLSDGRHVAVKKLEGSGNQGAKQFIAEVATIGSISHMNVVRLCGFCLEESQRLLVYEFMLNGSLDRWLFLSNPDSSHGNQNQDRENHQTHQNQNQNHQGLSWEQRIDIALGTARGLAYLHEECSEAIIHLDVKPQNILLDDRFVAKVGDFGMSKLLADRDVSQVMTCVRGTPGYLAPEWLLHSIATKKCDVYSYGMVLLEIIGGRKNLEVSRMNSDLSWYFPAWVVNEVRQGNYMGVVDEKIRVLAGEKQVRRLVHIALWCIQENPAIRPPMDEIVQMIEGHRDVEEPPMSFHFAVQTQAIVDITASRESVSMSSSVERWMVTAGDFHSQSQQSHSSASRPQIRAMRRSSDVCVCSSNQQTSVSGKRDSVWPS